MRLLNRNRDSRYNSEPILEYDDNEEEQPIEKFSKSAFRPERSSSSPASEQRRSFADSQPRSSYVPPRQPYAPPKASAPSFPGGPGGAGASSLYKVEPSQPRRRVEELFIAKITQSNDAMAVANLVKEKKYALIINLNELKESGAPDEYISVINFIDGVCYVTDSEFKEIVDGSGIYLIYHKDIVLNEGLSAYVQSSGRKY